jgi:hypothetical protein
MSDTATKHGILVCALGSAASDTAVAWATREATVLLLQAFSMAPKRV